MFFLLAVKGAYPWCEKKKNEHLRALKSKNAVIYVWLLGYFGRYFDVEWRRSLLLT